MLDAIKQKQMVVEQAEQLKLRARLIDVAYIKLQGAIAILEEMEAEAES